MYNLKNLIKEMSNIFLLILSSKRKYIFLTENETFPFHLYSFLIWSNENEFITQIYFMADNKITNLSQQEISKGADIHFVFRYLTTLIFYYDGEY